MHKKKSKNKKNKKETKTLASSSSSQKDKKTSQDEESTKKHKSSDKKHRARGHGCPTEKTGRDCSASEKFVPETSPKKDRHYKNAVYRLGKTARSGSRPCATEEKVVEKTHGCPRASLSQDRGSKATVNVSEGAKNSESATSKPLSISSEGRMSHSERRSSTSKSSSSKSSHRLSSGAATSRQVPWSLSEDLREQRRLLVKERSRPEETFETMKDNKYATSKACQDLQQPSALAVYLTEQRKLVTTRSRPKDKFDTMKDNKCTKSRGSQDLQQPSPEELKEKRRLLVKKRSRPEDTFNTTKDNKYPSQDLQLPSSLAEELKEKRRKLVRRRSQEEDLRTRRDPDDKQGSIAPVRTTQQSPTPTKNTTSETSTHVSKHVTSKHVPELSKTAKSTSAQVEVPFNKPKLPLTFTIPKKAPPAPVCRSIWDDDDDDDDDDDHDDKGSTDRKPPVSVSKPVHPQLGSKLMVPRKIRIKTPDRKSSVDSTKKICGPAPDLPSSSSVTRSPSLQRPEEKSTAHTSSVQTIESSSKTAEIYDNDQEMQLVEELHLARSERRLEVNVVEIYGELTCMDIDLPEEGAVDTLNKDHIQQELIVVLDTNVLLSHLDFVKKMRSHGLGGLGLPTVLIPWVVLQELDSLKNGKRLSSSVAHLATPAVHYIYTCLKSQEPRLWGQSMQQASLSSRCLNAENNDDRVLQCCLQYQSLYPGGALVLCTNDKNLCSKALLSGVKALSKADLVEEVERLRPGLHSNLHPHTPVRGPPLTHTQTPTLNQTSSQTQSSYHRTTSTSPVPVGQGEGRVSENHHGARDEGKEQRREEEKEEEERRRRSAAAEARELGACMSVLEDCLKGALSQILEVEMKAAYEDLWTEIVYLKPPWALEDVLQCFRKHWIAVFGNLVPRGLLQSVEALCDFLISGKTVERASTVVAICEARELLQAFSCRSEYCGCVSPALSSLDGLLQRIHPQPERSSEENHVCDGDTLMAEEEEEEEPKQTTPPRASNQEVWSLFEHIWTNVCQIRSAVFAALGFDLGTMEMSQPQDGAPPPQEALSCLHNLSSAVTHLLQAFSRVLSADSSLDDTQTLLTFIFTSQIAAMEPRFSAEDLKECLSQPEYREKLCVGGNQLAELSGTLERCSEAVARRSASTAWL